MDEWGAYAYKDADPDSAPNKTCACGHPKRQHEYICMMASCKCDTFKADE